MDRGSSTTALGTSLVDAVRAMLLCFRVTPDGDTELLELSRVEEAFLTRPPNPPGVEEPEGDEAPEPCLGLEGDGAADEDDLGEPGKESVDRDNGEAVGRAKGGLTRAASREDLVADLSSCSGSGGGEAGCGVDDCDAGDSDCVEDFFWRGLACLVSGDLFFGGVGGGSPGRGFDFGGLEACDGAESVIEEATSLSLLAATEDPCLGLVGTGLSACLGDLSEAERFGGQLLSTSPASPSAFPFTGGHAPPFERGVRRVRGDAIARGDVTTSLVVRNMPASRRDVILGEEVSFSEEASSFSASAAWLPVRTSLIVKGTLS